MEQCGGVCSVECGAVLTCSVVEPVVEPRDSEGWVSRATRRLGLSHPSQERVRGEGRTDIQSHCPTMAAQVGHSLYQGPWVLDACLPIVGVLVQ